MEPARFKAYLEAAIGKKAADLETVAPPQQGERTDMDTSRHHVGKSDGEERKEQRLRAILRAPEIVQTLYREGLVSQTAAALMGPQEPDVEKAEKVIQARNAIKELPRPVADNTRQQREYRKQVDHTIRETMGRPLPTPLDLARKALARLTLEERLALAREVIESETPAK